MHTKKQQRKKRISNKLKSISDRPQVIVNKSLKYLYLQLNDSTGKTLKTVDTKNIKAKTIDESIKLMTKKLTDFMQKNKITKITFNRNGFAYHGNVKKIAQALRDNKIIF